jgi:peptidoglycan/xylan/chitin deacetylase (PgdA/CDA1 family)
MQFEKGHFVISLDFELAWGVHDTRDLKQYGVNILGARKAIPLMLDLFEEFEVSVVWATVGFLFARNKDELLAFSPEILPNYTNEKRNPFRKEYFEKVGKDEKSDPFHFASDLLSEIASAKRHEIASHTFSHFYCLESGNTDEHFAADLSAAKAIAKDKGINLQSMVFPRNQYSENHLKLLADYGFTHFRGTEKSSIYAPLSREKETLSRRALRLADSFGNLTGHHVYTRKECREMSFYFPSLSKNPVINIPSSRFLRPFDRKTRLLRNAHLRRITDGMEYAAKNNSIYHLWWHPHNFGADTERNLSDLKQILQFFAHLRSEYGMTSSNMRDFSV